MSIPNFQTFMLPVLKILADGSARRPAEITNAAADALVLSLGDRDLLLPSGKMTVVRSRAGWALSYLKQAVLVKTISRGVYQITDRGRELLARGLSAIDIGVLEEFP